MKRINFVVLVFFILAYATSVFALEDLTPIDSGSGSQIIVPIQEYAQTAAAINNIGARLTSMETQLTNTIKRDDLAAFQEKIDEQFEYKTGVIVGRMLMVLLVWQVFFFATLFLAIAKGWLGSPTGKPKTIIQQEPIEKIVPIQPIKEKKSFFFKKKPVIEPVPMPIEKEPVQAKPIEPPKTEDIIFCPKCETWADFHTHPCFQKTKKETILPKKEETDSNEISIRISLPKGVSIK